MPLQAKILNVLQERKFYRVGGTKEVSVDVRIIAATNTNLEQLICKGAFRQDLYYRLNVIPLRIPPLSERREDILPLLTYYLEKSNHRYKRNKVISADALEVLMKYHWPGNIRELINVVERIVVIVDSPVVELRNLTEVAENSELQKLIQHTDGNRTQMQKKKATLAADSIIERSDSVRRRRNHTRSIGGVWFSQRGIEEPRSRCDNADPQAQS